MPKYSFECPCGLRFSRSLKMGEHPTHICPSCDQEAPRVWEGFAFNFAQGGSAPGNSGVAKHDYPTADQAVGSDAQKRWKEYRAREKVKTQVRKNSGRRPLIRKHGEGYIEYQAGDDKLVATRKKLVKDANELLRKRDQ